MTNKQLSGPHLHHNSHMNGAIMDQRGNKRPLIRGSNNNPSLSAGPRLHMAKVFATIYSPSTTEANEKDDLENMLQIRIRKIYRVTVKKLETLYDTYRSFLITCKVFDSSVFID